MISAGFIYETRRKSPKEPKIDKILNNLTSLNRSIFGKKNNLLGKKYKKAFEWCSGPAYIGFHLLEMGVCEKLCLADINPIAVESINNTIKENQLEDIVTCYLSDNLKSVPDSEMFDLVVANPPNYFNLNPDHPIYNTWKDDLRPNDPAWKIHKEFYSQITTHLLPGAILLIQEVEPFLDKVFLSKHDTVPYDIRDHIPAEVFKDMIISAGLKFDRIDDFWTSPQGLSMKIIASSFG